MEWFGTWHVRRKANNVQNRIRIEIKAMHRKWHQPFDPNTSSQTKALHTTFDHPKVFHCDILSGFSA